MSYLDSLNSTQKKNIDIIKDESIKQGITNPYAIAGLLSIISKESSFIPREETSYKNTSNSRIRKIFSRVSGLSESELTSLKRDDLKFFNTVYGGRFGNSSNEGYKYRGRGFNQITFKDSYNKMGKKINEPIGENPEKLLEPKIAAKASVRFLKDRISSLKQNGKLSSYNANDINDFKNEKDATMAFYHANTGSGKSVNYVKSQENGSTLGGLNKALSRVKDLYNYIYQLVKTEKIKIFSKKTKSTYPTIIITSLLVISVYTITVYIKKLK